MQIGDGYDTYAKEIKGDNVIITVGNGKIILTGATTLSTLNILGEESSSKKSPVVVTYNDKSDAKVTLAANVDVGNASSRKKAIRIVGNAFDNSILGGSKNDTLDGQDGNDLLVGNAGNDKLYGDNGNDTLWGGDGKDVIIGFTSDDTLTLDGISFTSATVNSKGTQFTLKLGSGSITFKDFAKDMEFNISEETYQVVKSGKKYSFVEK